MEAVRYSGRKFAVVSQSILPEKSGQSILLSRLLDGIPDHHYCVISNHPQTGTSSDQLPAKHYKIHDVYQWRLFKLPIVGSLLVFIAGFFELLRRKNEIAKILTDEGCDLAIACTGDLINLPATWLACRQIQIPFIAYVMDDFIYQWTGLRRLLARIFEKRLIHDASAILVLNEFVVRDYQERYGVSPVLLRNPAEDRFFISTTEPVDKVSKVFSLVYAGSIYRAHFDAFQLLSKTIDQYFRGKIEVHIYTPQAPSSLAKAGVAGDCLQFHGQISTDEVVQVYEWADALFLPLAFFSKIPEVLRSSAPFKMSEYLATGKPILVIAPSDSFLTWFFSENRCGFWVDKPDMGMLKDTLERLVSDAEDVALRGASARQIAKKFFSISQARLTFVETLNRAVC